MRRPDFRIRQDTILTPFLCLIQKSDGDYADSDLKLMFYYVLQFLYGGKWHMDCYARPEPYECKAERDRLWLIESARGSVRTQGLYVDGVNQIEKANLFLISHKTTADGMDYIGISPEPADAIAGIQLHDYE